ncbi:hypothetical protein ACRS6B_25065 [Nocardia asteroides]
MAVVHSSARGTTIISPVARGRSTSSNALVLGLATCLVLVLITGSPQTAVLVAAALGAARWLIGSAVQRRDAPRG